MSTNEKRREWRRIQRYVDKQLDSMAWPNSDKTSPDTEGYLSYAAMEHSPSLPIDCSSQFLCTANSASSELHNPGINTPTDETIPDFFINYDGDGSGSSDSEYEPDEDNMLPHSQSAFIPSGEASGLRDFLRKWSADYSITNSALSALLRGLKSECCSNCCATLPIDGRTLVKTNRNIKSRIQKIAGGEYLHVGVQQALQNHISFATDGSQKLNVIVNIDGLPIFKSSGLQFWPILMRVRNGDYDKPFIVGIFSGLSNRVMFMNF